MYSLTQVVTKVRNDWIKKDTDANEGIRITGLLWCYNYCAIDYNSNFNAKHLIDLYLAK